MVSVRAALAVGAWRSVSGICVVVVVCGSDFVVPFLVLFFFPALLLFDNTAFESCERLVSGERVILHSLDTEGIWEGATMDGFRCLLHPLRFFFPACKMSSLGGSLEVNDCSLLGSIVCGVIIAPWVTFCPLELSELSPYLLVTAVVLYGRGLCRTAYRVSSVTLHL